MIISTNFSVVSYLRLNSFDALSPFYSISSDRKSHLILVDIDKIMRKRAESELFFCCDLEFSLA